MNLFGRFLFATLFVTLITKALTDAAPDPEALDKLTLNVNIKDDDEKGNNDNDVYYDRRKNEYDDYETSKDENEDGDIEHDDYDTAIVPIFIKNEIGEPIGPEAHWGQWGPWGRCSVTCGRGKKSQHRKCIGGRPGSRRCKGRPRRTKPCRGPPCVYAQWCPWRHGRCDVTCGHGTERRERICSTRCYRNREKRQIGPETDSKSEDGEESGPGYFPPPHQCQEGQRDYDYIPCNPGPCPEPEHWCDFGPWSPCSVTCDGGTKTRQRECRRDCPHGPYWQGQREKRQIGTGTDTKSENGDEHGNFPPPTPYPWPQCREGDVDYDHEDCWEKPCWTTPRPTWTTTWETPTKPTWTTPRPTWTTTWTTRPGPIPRCICINPWEGTADSHFGDPDELCRTTGECYVECDYGCRDQKAAKEGAGRRCKSKVACDDSILSMAKETGQKDEN